LDIEQLNKATALMMKVDEATSYGKLTVNALERLENRLEITSLPSLGAKSTSENLSDIASSLSRIESMLCGGNSQRPLMAPAQATGFNSATEVVHVLRAFQMDLRPSLEDDPPPLCCQTRIIARYNRGQISKLRTTSFSAAIYLSLL
jgi:hypothetical protein